MRRVVTLMLLLAGAGRAARAQLPGEAVVRAAYRSSGGKWFRSAHWVQRTRLLEERRVETWYVTLQPPGMLRVDVAPGVTGRLLLSRNDSTYNFGKGTLRTAALDVQPLFVLLHDLHSAKPEKTIKMLQDYGFDLGKMHEQQWEGERVIVVGAAEGDTTSNQFWLEKRRMVLVRLIERNGSDPRRPLDARIGNYEKAGGGWLEQSVKLYLGGQLSTVEEYSDVKVDPPLEPGIFTPLPYRLPQWVHGAPDIFGNVPNMALPGGH